MIAAVAAKDAASGLAQDHTGSDEWDTVAVVPKAQRWYSVEVAGLRGEVADSYSCDAGVAVPGDKETATCRCEDRCRACGAAHMVQCILVRGVRWVGEREASAAQAHCQGEEDAGVGGDVGVAKMYVLHGLHDLHDLHDRAFVKWVSWDAEQSKAKAVGRA